MLNRTALIVRPKAPFINWARQIDESVMPEVGGEQTVYLIPECDDPQAVERVIKEAWAEIFARELSCWYPDESLWPAPINFAMFQSWFAVEYHTIIEDLCELPLEDDERD